ncbi:MAG: hypothetical protein QOG65_2831 [Actinomycetota bacterium]|jgi:hypothetical protein|nr:hypothetical protein [Actinomycetota bacterium]
MTEIGCAWLPPRLERFDALIKKINTTGSTGELRYTDEHKLLVSPASTSARTVGSV